jgi:hypothetical protein
MRLYNYITESQDNELSRNELSRKYNIPVEIIEILERFGTGIRPARGSGNWKKAHGKEIRKLQDHGLVQTTEDPQRISSSLRVLTDKGRKLYQARSYFYNTNLTKLIDDQQVDKKVIKDFPDIEKTAKNLK